MGFFDKLKKITSNLLICAEYKLAQTVAAFLGRHMEN